MTCDKAMKEIMTPELIKSIQDKQTSEQQHTPEPSAASPFENTQPPPKDKETTRFPMIEPSVEQRAKKLFDLNVLEIAKRAILAEDELTAAKQDATQMITSVRRSLQARLEGHNEGGDIVVMDLVDKLISQEVDRLTRGGCGLPGHTTVTADEGTCYCLTCEMISQRDALKAELSKLKQENK